jgi:indolepyruvate ferredoxin oxidoreductase alpha subunit
MNQTILAMTQAIEDAGVQHFTNYPGFHSDELFAAVGGAITSVDEKTAFAYAWGCSLAGKRAVVMFKNVGLNDAADAFIGAHFIGCRAGLVLVLFDDCDIQQSQNRVDTRPYFDICGGLWLEPRNVSEIYRLTRDAFELSERFELPVVIRVTNILYGLGEITRLKPSWKRTTKSRLPLAPLERKADFSPYLAHPSSAWQQELRLQEKMRAIAAYIEGLYADLGDKIRVSQKIVCGARQNAALDDAASIYTLPVPKKQLESLATDIDVDRLVVYEHGATPYMRDKIALAIAKSILPSYLMSPKDSHFQYHNNDEYNKLFSVLRNDKSTIVVGDIGSYSMDPERTIMASLCYGSAVAVGIGFAEALPDKRVFVVTGDAAYLHAGQTVLWEAEKRGTNLSIIILDNDGARATGGQHIFGNLWSHPEGALISEHEYAEMITKDFEHLLQDSKDNGMRIFILHNRRGGGDD